jgi:hypothetical protein
MALELSPCNLIVHENDVDLVRQCYEPDGAIIEHFDNASDHASAKFIPSTCSTGKKN